MTGRTVVLTGAGGGVGRGAAAQFLAAGDRVVAVDRDATALEVFAGQSAVTPVVADISDPHAVARVIEVAGPVDVLVNNAAVIDRLGRVHEASLEEWKRLLDINLTAPFMLCHAVLPSMLERGAGIIISVASVAGLNGGRAGAAYTASKHGLVGMTKNIAATMGHLGIRANVVAPGSIETNMQQVPQDFPDAIATLSRDGLKPSPARPDEIADVITYLASEQASRINGVALPVDGGSLAF